MRTETAKSKKSISSWDLPPDKPGIGTGIYELTDLKRILGLETRKIKRWLKSYWDADFANGNKYSWGEDKTYVNFYSMIEFYVFGVLRDSGVSIRVLRTAHKTLSERLNTQYPFASRKLQTDGKRVFVELEKDTLADAEHSIQYVFKEIIDPFCKKLEFDSINGLATSFFPLGSNHKISLRPGVMFGQPTIEGTRIPAETIYKMYKGEDCNAKRVASLYSITEKAVNDAVQFFEAAA